MLVLANKSCSPHQLASHNLRPHQQVRSFTQANRLFRQFSSSCASKIAESIRHRSLRLRSKCAAATRESHSKPMPFDSLNQNGTQTRKQHDDPNHTDTKYITSATLQLCWSVHALGFNRLQPLIHHAHVKAPRTIGLQASDLRLKRRMQDLESRLLCGRGREGSFEYPR